MTRRWTEGVRREVLANGLTLLAQRDATAPAVAVVSHIRAGFFDEPDRLAGISHVLEHMLFKGTPTRGVGALAQETRLAGGYLNAFTSYDHTSYYTVLPAASLPVALDLQSDALRRSTLDAGELRRELRVIIEEAKRKLDTPGAVVSETLHQLLFDHHRIRRWRIGTEAQLAGLSHADLVAYYRSRYVPERTIVAMAGDLDLDEALSMARECFDGWPAAAGAVDRSPEEPPIREVRARTLRGDVRQADLVLGWRGVPALHPDAAALDVAAALLGAGRASWLYQALRVPGIVTSAGAWHYSPTEVGVFSIGADLDPARVQETLLGAAGCVGLLAERGPSAEELERVRRLLTARWARRLESVEGRASAFAAAEALGGVELLDREYERVLAVDAEAVRAAAAEYLRPDSVMAVAYLPEGRGPDLSADLLREAFGAERLATPTAPAPSPSLRVPPPSPGVRGTTTAGVLHVELPGADLLIGRKPGVPLVSLGVYRRRTIMESAAQAGLGALAVRSAVRGAGDLDAAALADRFERLGGALSAQVAVDWYGFSTSVLSECAAEAAALLGVVLEAPRFEAEEVGRERGTMLDEAVQAADDMVRHPLQLAYRGAFGDSGYGLPVHGLPESLPGLTEGMVRAWHAFEGGTGRTTVVAIGDLEPERTAEALAGVFGGGGPREAAPHPAPVAWGAGAPLPHRAVELRGKRQTALGFLFPGPGRGDRSRFTAEVWAAVASGLGGRLFGALRDERSLAYTVMASSWQRLSAGALLLYLATSPEREEEAREALLAELAKFREAPPTEGELRRAANYLAGQAQVHRQTAGSLAGEVADAWLLGSGLGELADPGAPYHAVSGAMIASLAREHLDPGLMVEGVVRGGSSG